MTSFFSATFSLSHNPVRISSLKVTDQISRIESLCPGHLTSLEGWQGQRHVYEGVREWLEKLGLLVSVKEVLDHECKTREVVWFLEKEPYTGTIHE